MKQLTSLASRILFLGAALLAGLALYEKLLQMGGYTLLRGLYQPWRLLEFSAIALFFVIALQLRDIKHSLGDPGSG